MKFATSDIEANHWVYLVAIGLFDGTDYNVFDSIDNYLDFIITKKYNGYRIYFHNGGRYDFLFLVEKLLDRGDVTFVQKSSGLLLLKFRTTNFNCEFADSFAILPASLEKLIQTYNIEEKKIKIDFKKGFKFSDKKMQEHLKNDCISLYKILEQTEKYYGFLSLTVPAQALRIFTKDYFSGYIYQASNSFDKYFRENYYKGGRVEVYKGFGENLYYYDVNSLYPFVMLQKMPIGEPIKTKKYINNKSGFYKIKLKSKTDFKISPISIKKDGANYYVNGDIGDTFYLTSVELKYLIEKKIKYEVIEGYYFEREAYLFEDFVNHFYEKKKNAKDEVERYIAKLMLNALYGKMGQSLEGENIKSYEGEKNYKIFDASNDLILVTQDRKVKYRGVYIAAYITSLARMHHLKLMEKIGFEHIYYCDTDSIITDKKINTGKDIGELKLEDEIKEGVFLMPKVYGYLNKERKTVTHYKGFTKNKFKYSSLKKLLLGEKKELIESKERILGFKEAVRRKNDIKYNNGTFLKVAMQDKILKNKYDKRKLIESEKHIFETNCFRKSDLI